MSAASLTPAKRGIDPENSPIQPEKHPKIVDDLPPGPGSKVEQPKIAGGAKFGYDIKLLLKGGICEICNKRTTHTLFSCPDKEKAMIVRDGVKQLHFCYLCSTVGHMDEDCPLNEFDLDLD